MQKQAKSSKPADKKMINQFVQEFKNQGNSFDDIKNGKGFPASFPEKIFPLDKMQEYVMYHEMKSQWNDWLEEKFDS